MNTFGRPVAFLQNAWVRDPDRLRKTFASHDEAFRLEMLRRLLFAGCVTGRRLRAAFGDLCEVIVWEECTREIAGSPKVIIPADPVHIAKVIETINPPIVIAFGQHAGKAVRPVCTRPLLFAPHPAARQASTPSLLEKAAEMMKMHMGKVPERE